MRRAVSSPVQVLVGLPLCCAALVALAVLLSGLRAAAAGESPSVVVATQRTLPIRITGVDVRLAGSDLECTVQYESKERRLLRGIEWGFILVNGCRVALESATTDQLFPRGLRGPKDETSLRRTVDLGAPPDATERSQLFFYILGVEHIDGTSYLANAEDLAAQLQHVLDECVAGAARSQEVAVAP